MVDTSIATDEIESEFRKVQDHICNYLAKESGQQYREDLWNYAQGTGGGITRVWEDVWDFAEGAPPKAFLEKGGVNFSSIHGRSMPDSAATALKIPQNTPYIATGVSLVIHPKTPHIPTIHANIRYFQCGSLWWFGGGVDVTPYYVNKERVIEFHKTLKTLCEKWGHNYESYKKQCDEYFFLPHRNECRGAGGLFFDHLQTSEALPFSKKELCSFLVDVCMHFPQLYGPFINEGKDLVVTSTQKDFHLYRRARYVEFNLIYDRGTRFGLQSEGRIESILMSMPPVATWRYDWHPQEGTPEAELYELIKPKDWVSM